MFGPPIASATQIVFQTRRALVAFVEDNGITRRTCACMTLVLN
jgi:hypothetical protein